MRIKICGLTTLDDALLAADAGADLLGFIFYAGSKRHVTVDGVRPIAARLRARPACPLLVGVFVNETAATMAAVLDACTLDLAQLHGDEVPRLIGDPASPLYGRSFKAIRPHSYLEAQAEAEWYVPPTPRPDFPDLLVDAWHPTAYGGTGETGDWALAAQLTADVPRLLLAGGLTPDNVARAVAQVRPWGVDVAGGTEAAPGRKDPARLHAFIANARRAAADLLPL